MYVPIIWYVWYGLVWYVSWGGKLSQKFSVHFAAQFRATAGHRTTNFVITIGAYG